MNYQNIDTNGNVVIAPDKKYSKSELFENFIEFITYSNFSIVKIFNGIQLPYHVIIKNENKEWILYFFLKNITGAGWADKPNIKRVQIKNTSEFNQELIPTNDKQLLTLFGYYNFDNNPIMVAWDAYRYDHHRTLRSCYVSVNLLQLGYQKGFCCSVDAGNRLWLFDRYHFKEFLIDYIKYEGEHHHVSNITKKF